MQQSAVPLRRLRRTFTGHAAASHHADSLVVVPLSGLQRSCGVRAARKEIGGQCRIADEQRTGAIASFAQLADHESLSGKRGFVHSAGEDLLMAKLPRKNQWGLLERGSQV